MALSSTAYNHQSHREHEETRALLLQADKALRDLLDSKRKLAQATKLYRERYEGRRDQRGE